MGLDQCSAWFLIQPVLHIGSDWIGHKQRSVEFKQRRPLDGLHMSPQMAIIIAQVAVPPPAGPRLKLERHRLAVRGVVFRTQLYEQCANVVSRDARTCTSCVTFNVKFSIADDAATDELIFLLDLDFA